MSASHYRCIDRPKAPQAVTVEFERVLIRDEHAGAPDTMQDGFWPSKDPDAAGYVEPKDFKRAQGAARLRMNRWRADLWHYVGVVARAHVSVPIGGSSFALYTLDSPGLWGIESDAGEYLDEVYREQLDELKGQLRDMGQAFADLFRKPGG